MSHFYGKLQGTRGAATRCGHKKTGMETICASFQGAIQCTAWHDEATGKDMVRVEKITWCGKGEYKTLYQGEIGVE